MTRKYRDNPKPAADRRAFLRGAAVLGGGAVTASLMPVAAQAGELPDADTQPKAAETGYRVTEHIAHYYQTLKS